MPTKKIKKEEKMPEIYQFDIVVAQLTALDLLLWAFQGLQLFKAAVIEAPVDDMRSYSHSFEALRKTWYNFLHARIDENDFVSGKPEENTWIKRPKACFWWQVYCADPQYYFPFYDHHCSSKQRKEQMLNMIDKMIDDISQATLEGKKV